MITYNDGKKLKEVLKLSGMTVKDWAKKVGLTPPGAYYVFKRDEIPASDLKKYYKAVREYMDDRGIDKEEVTQKLRVYSREINRDHYSIEMNGNNNKKSTLDMKLEVSACKELLKSKDEIIMLLKEKIKSLEYLLETNNKSLE